ncbi:MAG: Tim44/TimA family putative adaptor protein [Geminicoccaceae bacterium]
MSEGFAYLDILLFAMVAAFVALRLRSVLGRRTGNERRRPGRLAPEQSSSESENVVRFPDAQGQAELGNDDGIADVNDDRIKAALTEIRMADPQFNLNNFLAGARTAFEMIVEAFARGDKDQLKPLLANDVYNGFARAIDERADAGQHLETQLIAIRSSDVADAELRNREARVTVRFVSEQINVVRGADGEVIEGEPASTEEITDLWTFARDTRARDPNWQLVETRTE